MYTKKITFTPIAIGIMPFRYRRRFDTIEFLLPDEFADEFADWEEVVVLVRDEFANEFADWEEVVVLVRDEFANEFAALKRANFFSFM